jgi:hypothetical protein
MAREKFREWNPRAHSRELVATCNAIIRRLSKYQLTLRQLYYQLVSKNIVPNTERSYQNLSSLVTRARLAGLMDWHAIEDRVRQPRNPPEFSSLSDLVETALRSYRLPRWRGQEYYAELWVEKDALASVLAPLARQFHVTLMVNRGYSSASAMKEGAERFRPYEYDRQLALFYLGDLDPSGEDMVRDIRTRMHEFGICGLTVEKIALTIEQVHEYDPPPNPAKMTDVRAPEYVAKYGTSSWEVDALDPEVLEEVITDAFEGILDHEIMDAIISQEEDDKATLRNAVGDSLTDDEDEDDNEDED